MNAITKPMLATKCECPAALRFPVLATPKLDGIRCLKLGGKALTRSFKPISNRFAREWIEANLPDGLDGELMLRGGTFNETTSAIGARDGRPDFVFHVFDYVTDSIATPYRERMKALAALPESDRIVKVLPVEIRNAAELAAYEEECIAAGYEGVMVRTPNSPYKCGRSTEREGWLLKIKRFEDDEAVVLTSYEGMTNQNAAELDAFGRTKRSLAQAGMVGRNELGGFVVRHLKTGVEFRLGYTPRDARKELKRLLGLQSLSGIVYSITEIPVELIREIVDARLAELAGGAPLQTPVPADVDALVMERLQPILRRLAALEQTPVEEPAPCTRFDPLAVLPEPTAEPDWNLVKRHYRRYGNPEATAAKYGIGIRDLKARARREGWDA